MYGKIKPERTKEVTTMYEVIMGISKNYMRGEYIFKTKKECEEFLGKLNDYELDTIKEINKYNKKSCRPAWKDFFQY